MADDDRSALFRREALAARQDGWLGSVLLTPRISHTVYTSVVAALVAGVIALIGFGEYTRKVRLHGWLAPEQGLIEVAAPQSGVLSQVAAYEGLDVKKDDPLVVISTERRSEAVGATQGEVLRTLRERRDSLVAERERHRALYARNTASQNQRLAALDAETASLDAQLTLQRQRVELADVVAESQRDLRARGLVVARELRDAEQAALDQALTLRELERTRAALTRVRVELEAGIAELPLREELQIAEIDRAIAGLDQELAEAEAAREVVVAAPQAGTITAIRAAAGDGIAAAEPLMTLIPEGVELEARLYGPSRDIGFVKPGQRVLLRYDAFPYQKFGRHEAVVRSVSRATVGAGELAEASAALAENFAVSGEPVYRITVRLARQTTMAHGEPAPLQPGMTLSADVLIESRRLWQWVLDPLYSLSGSRV